jgi:predicted enzyme related to lactoylglutathione lyase
MASHIHNFSFNTADPYRLAQFWSKVTQRPLHEEDKPGDPEASIDLGNGTNLFFQVDPKPKKNRNRLHVCLQPDIPRDQEVERLVGIGATLFDDHRQPDGTGWAVLRDPEGNEFCVERSAAERAATS